MEGQNYLGIYLSRDSATVVCLGSQGREADLIACFSVTLEQQEERSPGSEIAELAGRIAEGCAQRELNYSDVAVALDGAMFMQHQVRSEFRDAKQIAQTVRFDAEEALSTDISDVAVAFKIASVGQTGSELNVFTAQREVLSNVLLSLQSNNIDPVTVEPDVNCLSRFVVQRMSVAEDSRFLFGMLSARNGYLVGSGKSPEAPFVRTFLVGRKQDRTDLLARQIPVTIVSLGSGRPIDSVGVFDYAGSVSSERLAERLGLEVTPLDLAGSAGVGPEFLADCAGPVDFAIAFGAALAHSEKVQTVNFRNDFMPYQGKKRRLEKALKVLSVSVSILMLALGIYVTAQLLQTNKYRRVLLSNLEKDYSPVMSGQRLPDSMASALRKLRSLSKRIQSEQNPMLADESLSARLRVILEAFNKCAKQTRLNIDSITVGSKTVRIMGDTSNRKNTLRLRNAIAQSKLGSMHESIETTKTGRAAFRITIELGKE
ncbi:MAG: type II secretion system protein GspL [Planctomycetota bacterium]